MADAKNEAPAQSRWWIYHQDADFLVLHLNLSNNANCEDWCATTKTKPFPSALHQHQGMARDTGFSDWTLMCHLHEHHKKGHFIIDQPLPAPTKSPT
jgi:hypothetical protein